VEARGDGIPQNNHSRLYVDVTCPPRALYVSGPGRGSESLLSALEAQGIGIERRSVADLPGTLTGYLPSKGSS